MIWQNVFAWSFSPKFNKLLKSTRERMKTRNLSSPPGWSVFPWRSAACSMVVKKNRQKTRDVPATAVKIPQSLFVPCILIHQPAATFGNKKVHNQPLGWISKAIFLILWYPEQNYISSENGRKTVLLLLWYPCVFFESIYYAADFSSAIVNGQIFVWHLKETNRQVFIGKNIYPIFIWQLSILKTYLWSKFTQVNCFWSSSWHNS